MRQMSLEGMLVNGNQFSFVIYCHFVFLASLGTFFLALFLVTWGVSLIL